MFHPNLNQEVLLTDIQSPPAKLYTSQVTHKKGAPCRKLGQVFFPQAKGLEQQWDWLSAPLELRVPAMSPLSPEAS